MIAQFICQNFKIYLGLLFSLALLAGLPACNTIEGAGKDVEAAGEVMSETARDVKDEISD